MNEISVTALAMGILAIFGIAIPAYTPAVKQNESEYQAPAITALDSTFTAQSVLAFDVANGRRIVDVDSSRVLPIASITKIMTDLIALEHILPEEQVVLSKEAVSTDGDVAHLRAYELFLAKDLLRAMMMSSSNDAAMALAEETGERMGGKIFEDKISLFVEAMNRKARELGMRDTRFENPTGLDNSDGIPSNYSTALDLERLVAAARNEPILWELSRDTAYTIYSDRGREYFLFNLNEIAGDIPNLIGSKTGSTPNARDSLVFLFEYPLGKPRAVILLGAERGRRFEEAKRILEMTLGVLP